MIMRRFLLSIITIIFVLWLLPLAPFVAPSEDAKVCEGRRAICLCRHQRSADSQQASSMTLAFQSSGQAQTQKDAGGLAPRFLPSFHQGLSATDSQSRHLFSYEFLYSFRHIPQVIHIPKSA